MTNYRRFVVTVALCVGTAAGATIAATPAYASAIPLRVGGATTLAGSLGSARTAGVYVDATTGRAVVTVTDAAAARTVRSAGGIAHRVNHSADDLNALMARVDSGVAGTAWSVDPAGNQLVIDVDSTVTGIRLIGLEAAVTSAGGAARINRVPGRFSMRISGGDAIYGGGIRCSLGFNVRDKAGALFFLTAGHCTDLATEWFANSARTIKLGNRAGTSFPGNDYGIVRYTDTSIAIKGTVGGVDITSAGNATVGQVVTRRGSTTGTHSGLVTGLNATVHYAEGSVRQLIRTSVCAEGGDSGGPLYAGGVALGLTSGGSGNCLLGGTTFFQPVLEVLSTYKVSVF